MGYLNRDEINAFRKWLNGVYRDEMRYPEARGIHIDLEGDVWTSQYAQYRDEGKSPEMARWLVLDEIVSILKSGNNEHIPVLPQRPAVPPLLPLRVDGYYLATSDGKRWFAKGMTEFLLYMRFLNGEDIRPVLAECQALGCNIVRVFGMVTWGPLIPRDHPDYYDRIPAFLDLLAEYRLYCYWTVFCDTRIILPNVSDQLTHYSRVVEQLRSRPNVVLELVNECDANSNYVEIWRFPKPQGLLSCCGSNGGDATPPLPPFDISDFHARRDLPSAIKDMCVLELRDGWDNSDGRYPGTHGPIWHGEPVGFAETYQADRRWADPRLAAELAGTARGTACGIVYHSDDGVQARPLGPVQRRCAEAFFGALEGVM
jgi:hypothetical protein